MKALFINTVCGMGSTGRICLEQAEELIAKGYEVRIAYGREARVPEEYNSLLVKIGNDFDVKMHGVITRAFDRHGFASKKATKKFLKWANKYNPDLLILHNIHGYYINVEQLFDWIKKRPNMKIRWTLHDCWAFTGHCSYFTMAQCNRWKTQCFQCPQKKKYPSSLLLDNSRKNYFQKKKLFTNVNNLTLVTPSKWLSDLVHESFLKEYDIEINYNNINKEIFKPTNNDFRKIYKIEDKKIILGVAGQWDERKGLDDFIKLANIIETDTVIVLVGLNDEQLCRLPQNCIGMKKTQNAVELAALYTTADIFFNPTYEDNYPTVNLESEACGTPVITYNVGGAKETLKDSMSCAIDVGNYMYVADFVRKMKDE